MNFRTLPMPIGQMTFTDTDTTGIYYWMNLFDIFEKELNEQMK